MRQFTLFLSDTIFIALIYMQSTNNFMLANDAILVYDDQLRGIMIILILPMN